MRSMRVIVITFLVNGVCALAHAGVVGTTGAVTSLFFTPLFLDLGELESNIFISEIAEQKNVQLNSALAVDISLPSTVPSSISVNLTPGVVAAGTRVDSYLLHFDPIGTPSQPLALSGSVTFSLPVLGIEVLTTSLNSTDTVLGIPGAFYPIGEVNRGLELSVGLVGIETFDGITLSLDRKTVSVILSTQLSLDQVRVITAVPEPSSLTQFGIGAVGLAGGVFLRRRFTIRRTKSLHGNGLARVLRSTFPARAMRLFVALLICSVALGSIAPAARAAFTITYQAAADPTTEGFITGTFGTPSTAGPLANDLGLPAWHITGGALDSQFGYGSGTFSASQRADLANLGATLTLVARAVQQLAPTWTPEHHYGILAAGISTGAFRFDVAIGLDANGDTVVILPNSFGLTGPGGSIEGSGPAYTLAGSGAGYHTYSLVFSPGLTSANLFVDGISRIQGYTGDTSFVGDTGLGFSAFSGGQGNFNFVQLQSVPEPSSLVLALGAGALGLLAHIRRRCRRPAVGQGRRD